MTSSNKSNHCDIKYDKIVKWTIYSKNIKDQLIGTKSKPGLLFLDYESAGEIEFKDNSNCSIKDNEKTCDKETSKKLKFNKGSNDSVITPLSVINFHTHPLSCYIDAETIWGWPSGEDLARAIEFAIANNICHIVFAVEGTYVIEVNKELLNKFNKSVIKILINNIEKIFQLTHKHRMYYNDESFSLEDEFNKFFLKPLNLKDDYINILYAWIDLVNNINILNLYKLMNSFSKEYFKKMKLKELPEEIINDLNDSIFKEYIYHISFYPNKTIQLNQSLSKQQLVKLLKNKDFKIELPDKIIYKAPFISEKCIL